MVVLLSIKPKYAQAIFDGVKCFEYRRSIFKERVDRVVVYASAPVCKVIGEFEVGELIHDDLSSLWAKTAAQGGITHETFCSYFDGKTQGYAIEVVNPQVYEVPRCLKAAYGKAPPQSYAYLTRK